MRIVRTDLPIIACAISFGFWHRILIGRQFDSFPSDQRAAIIAHEEGHIAGAHTEQRILMLLFLPMFFTWLCRRQEFAADRYAADCGHVEGLSRLLASDGDGGILHPSHYARREALKLHEHPRVAPVTGYFDGFGVTDQGV